MLNDVYEAQPQQESSDGSPRSTALQELETYLALPVIKHAPYFDLIRWWMSQPLPHLSALARAIFSVDATSCEAERNFSQLGLLCSDRRSGMTKRTVERMVRIRINRSFLPKVKEKEDRVKRKREHFEATRDSARRDMEERVGTVIEVDRD
ncbi:unnamed protein product [Chrysoparadoxa australica]